MAAEGVCVGSVREGPTVKNSFATEENTKFIVSTPLWIGFVDRYLYFLIILSSFLWVFFWLPEERPSLARTRLQGYFSSQFQIPELSSVASCAILCPTQSIFLQSQSPIWPRHWGWSWMSAIWAPLRVTVPCRFRECLYKAKSMRTSSLKWMDFTSKIQNIRIQGEFQ